MSQILTAGHKGRTMTTDDVIGLLDYKPNETTEALYEMGSMLLAEGIDRGKQLDARAIALAGYSGITTALLVSTFATRLSGLPLLTTCFVIAAGICLFVTVLFAFGSLWIREYEWFSDKDWFAPTNLSDPELLRRAHVLAMHQYRANHEVVNTRKAEILGRAYVCLMICGGLLAVGLAVIRL